MTDRLVEFLLTALVIELTPGPNMSWLVLLAARSGWRIGLEAVAGIALGLALVGLAAALGVSALIQSSAVLYQGLRWGGVAFLLYLAVEAWIGESAKDAPIQRGHLWRGVALNLLNPKAASVFLTLIPSFAHQPAPGPQALITLSFVYIAVATSVHVALVLAASRLQFWLQRPGLEVTVRRVIAILLAMVAVWLFLATSR